MQIVMETSLMVLYSNIFDTGKKAKHYGNNSV